MKVGYQGVAGSYSEAALKEYCHHLEEVEAVGYPNFSDLIEDVAHKRLDMIVLPVENSTTGFIARSADLLRHQPVVAIADNYQSIQHTLWSLADSSVEQLTKVYSHPEALGQCDAFFDSHPYLTAAAYEDTAKAAAYVAEMQDPKLGALASPYAGKLHGLQALQTSVQTEKSNTTRFYIMRHQDDARLSGTLLSLYVEMKHETGALSKLLQVFDLFEGNLLGLNARPIPDQPFRYGFFIEVSLNHLNIPFVILWQTLEHIAEYVQLLGQFDPVKGK